MAYQEKRKSRQDIQIIVNDNPGWQNGMGLGAGVFCMSTVINRSCSPNSLI